MQAIIHWSRRIVALVVLVLGACLLSATPVHAAGYHNQTLVADLGLPAKIVQVMLANSLDASGARPSVAVNDVTVDDVATWQTVSLADRSQNADGTFTSSPDATVRGVGCRTGGDHQRLCGNQRYAAGPRSR